MTVLYIIVGIPEYEKKIFNIALISPMGFRKGQLDTFF